MADVENIPVGEGEGSGEEKLSKNELKRLVRLFTCL